MFSGLRKAFNFLFYLLWLFFYWSFQLFHWRSNLKPNLLLVGDFLDHQSFRNHSLL